MKRNFIAIYTIICPECNVKQTGIIRIYDTKTLEPIEIEEDYKPSDNEIFAIRCCWTKCGHLIAGEQLNEVTQKTVSSPADY